MGADLLKKMSAIVKDDVINEEVPDYPSNAEFFAGKTIGITGGTGFLGQGIIEKLLRCCPDVKKIILFIRNKRSQTPKQRLEVLINLPAFNVLHQTQPDFPAKLSFVACDLEADDLGLSDESVELLHNEVEIFFHCAATVKFNEHLRTSFMVNVLCLRKLLRVATGMKRLQAFIHTSTAFVHCNQRVTDEKFYDVGIDYLDLEGSLRWMDDDLISKVTPEIVGQRPNTYTLTKALAEDVVVREGSHLPICIVRPSMIIPAYKEPLPGWCTNVYGPTAFVVAFGKGFLRSLIADPDIVADLVPVDLVVNGSIAAAMKTACDNNNESGTRSPVVDEAHRWTDLIERHNGDCGCGHSQTSLERNREIPIYAITTGEKNPLHIHKLISVGVPMCEAWPLDPIRCQFMHVTQNKLVYQFNVFLRQTLPAFCYDVYLSLSNRRTVMLRMNEKLLTGMKVMEFFFTKDFVFGISNAEKLQKCLTQADRKAYNFDAKALDWEEQMKSYVMGARQFLVKESMDGYPQARRKMKTLKLLNLCMDVLGLMLFLGFTGIAAFIWKLIAPIRSLFAIHW